MKAKHLVIYSTAEGDYPLPGRMVLWEACGETHIGGYDSDLGCLRKKTPDLIWRTNQIVVSCGVISQTCTTCGNGNAKGIGNDRAPK